MEDSLSNSLWLLRMDGSPRRPYQCSRRFPALYERHLRRSSRHLCHCLLGRHLNLLRRHCSAQEARTRSTTTLTRSWSLRFSEEVLLSHRLRRVLGIYPYSDRTLHGRRQDKDYPRLAPAAESKGHSIIFRFCQLLPPFHLRILRHRCSPHSTYAQICYLGFFLRLSLRFRSP